MKNTIYSEALSKYFNFLTSAFGFSLKEIKSHDYALYAKFMSNTVGIYFIYEFRDFIPRIQFMKLETSELNPRPGIYTIKELYRDEKFKLKSFYLDEILQMKGLEYKNYFNELSEVEEAIKISAELIQKHAMDFASGNEESYEHMDKWFRNKITTFNE